MNGYNYPKTYMRRYSDFVGVDFGPERSMVAANRFPYAKNVFKDYKKGGRAIESMPGFRTRFDLRTILSDAYPLVDHTSTDLEVFGIFCYDRLTSGGRQKIMLIHGGNYMFAIKNCDSETPVVSILCSDMAKNRSCFFLFDNIAYVLDGKKYRSYDGTTFAPVVGYVPTTVIGVVPDGENANAGERYEQSNVLTRSLKNRFVPTGTATEFYLSESGVSSISSVTLYGESVDNEDYAFDSTESKITFSVAPEVDESYDVGYSGLEVIAVKEVRDDPISKCVIACVYDNAVFFSGNPDHPGRLYFSALNDPTYVGELNYITDGRSNSPIKAMISLADCLMVVKDSVDGEGAVFYHRPRDTSVNLKPRDYPSASGCDGEGCVSAAVNFSDEAVYLSKSGLKAVGSLNINLERNIEHRSSMIDSVLTNCDLSGATMAEWQGFLIISAGGKMFLGDSRSRFKNAMGEYEYEWFYAEDIGVYRGQYIAYEYMTEMPAYLAASQLLLWDGVQKTANLPDPDGTSSRTVAEKSVLFGGESVTYHTVSETVYDYEGNGTVCEYPVKAAKYYIGGVFSPATVVANCLDNLFFGTTDGQVCSFNFDMRSGGDFISAAYSANGRIFPSEIDTVSDACLFPGNVKNTVPHSLTLKFRASAGGRAKIATVTDGDRFLSVGVCDSDSFSFGDVDFSAFTFQSDSGSLGIFNENRKNWREKQIVVYSDEYQKHFALYQIAYEYYEGRKVK